MYLNCKTYFSYRYGTFSTTELVEEGAEKGAEAMALTNINNTSDWWDFYTFCQEKNIKPVLGVEIRNEDELVFIVIAKDKEGLLEINRFLSCHLQGSGSFPSVHSWSAQVWVIYPLGKKDPSALSENERIGLRASEV
ncbi:MAG TPA: PHP domain-containing protein, partial [Phnomibacter sp.]|nr:PHP domain-containing protein [Phnomibacter sp.]